MDTESDERAWKRRAAASLAWFTGSQHASGRASDITPDLVREMVALRTRIREAEGGGGMCHYVSEELQRLHGWTQLSVGYLAPDGCMACASHYVNLLGDGTIVDATADQFGEGHDVKVVLPNDPGYGRYRPEFYEDFNPDIEPEALAAWLPDWTGVIDFDAQDTLDAERGPAWWLDDPTPRLEYLREQLGYMTGPGRNMHERASTEAEIEAIEGRLALRAPGP